MKNGPDLNSADRETLLAVIAEQQLVIAALRRRIDELERRVTRGPSGGMPGNKPSKRGESESRKPRKQRAHGFARRRMEPTRRVIHAAESCPECGTGLAGGWVQRTREVIELPLAPAEVVEQVFMARMCALCGQRWLPRDQLKGLVMGRQRFGVNLVSLIVTLREEGRLPIRSIQQYLQTVHQLKLSVGAIVDTIHRVARQAQPVVAEMVERIRGSPVVHADETGWRQDGVNGYVWTFSTPTDRYFLRRGRGKEVVDEALGDSFDGVVKGGVILGHGAEQKCTV